MGRSLAIDFSPLRCLLLYPACVDLDTPFKSFDSISLCHCYAESFTSGRAGGLPFAGPSKGPHRKRNKNNVEPTATLSIPIKLLQRILTIPVAT